VLNCSISTCTNRMSHQLQIEQLKVVSITLSRIVMLSLYRIQIDRLSLKIKISSRIYTRCTIPRSKRTSKAWALIRLINHKHIDKISFLILIKIKCKNHKRHLYTKYSKYKLKIKLLLILLL
jgi:hypothetical protein